MIKQTVKAVIYKIWFALTRDSDLLPWGSSERGSCLKSINILILGDKLSQNKDSVLVGALSAIIQRSKYDEMVNIKNACNPLGHTTSQFVGIRP